MNSNSVFKYLLKINPNLIKCQQKETSSQKQIGEKARNSWERSFTAPISNNFESWLLIRQEKNHLCFSAQYRRAADSHYVCGSASVLPAKRTSVERNDSKQTFTPLRYSWKPTELLLSSTISIRLVWTWENRQTLFKGIYVKSNWINTAESNRNKKSS